MPNGCDFICLNKACQHTHKRITMHLPWAVLPIDEAIDMADKDGDEENKNALKARKENGNLFALFVYPRDKDRTPIAFRVQWFCANDKMLAEKEMTSMEDVEAAYKDDVPCPRCGEPLKTLTYLVEKGFACPYCSVQMNAYCWTTL